MSQKFQTLADQLQNFSTTEELAPTIRQLGTLIGNPGLTDQIILLLKPYLKHADAKLRRYAIQALEKSASPKLEDDFLELWRNETRPDVQKVLLAALGKIGGTNTGELFSTLKFENQILQQAFEKSFLILKRNLGREAASEIAPLKTPASPLPALVHCRKGLEKFTAQDFDSSWNPQSRGPGRIEVTLNQNLNAFFRSRTMLRFGFPLGEFSGKSPAEAITQGLLSPRAQNIFKTWTTGKIRFRLDIAKKGHQRSLVWEVAKLIARHSDNLVNDPTDALWEVLVSESGKSKISLELIPKGLIDPRFYYRLKDVPAASHPTIAAALVKIGGIEAKDIVFDPFVGSGGELIERALAGPYQELFGTDIDPKAVEAAKANGEKAGIYRLNLLVESFESFRSPAPSLILSNPPMGRRVEAQNAEEIVMTFVRHGAEILAPRGRMVFASPFPAKTIAAAKKAGLIHVFSQTIDMGGFSAEIQSYRKP